MAKTRRQQTTRGSHDVLVRYRIDPDARGGDTQIALLDAAKRLIAERGYSGTTVRDLAAASGTNLAAVNYHFGSRANLLQMAVFESFREMVDSLGQVGLVDPRAGALEQMAARARPVIAGVTALRQAFLVALATILEADRSPELKSQLVAHYADQRRRLGEQLMSATTTDGELSDRMVEVVASYILAVADGLQLQALLDPQAIPTGDELAALYEGLAAATRASGPAL